MGTDTVLEVGVDPVMKERYQVLQAEIRESEKILNTSKPVLVHLVEDGAWRKIL